MHEQKYGTKTFTEVRLPVQYVCCLKERNFFAPQVGSHKYFTQIKVNHERKKTTSKTISNSNLFCEMFDPNRP